MTHVHENGLPIMSRAEFLDESFKVARLAQEGQIDDWITLEELEADIRQPDGTDTDTVIVQGLGSTAISSNGTSPQAIAAVHPTPSGKRSVPSQ